MMVLDPYVKMSAMLDLLIQGGIWIGIWYIFSIRTHTWKCLQCCIYRYKWKLGWVYGVDKFIFGLYTVIWCPILIGCVMGSWMFCCCVSILMILHHFLSENVVLRLEVMSQPSASCDICSLLLKVHFSLIFKGCSCLEKVNFFLDFCSALLPGLWCYASSLFSWKIVPLHLFPLSSLLCGLILYTRFKLIFTALILGH